MVRFPVDHPVFVDHFPGKPIVPGVLITEAMGQTAGWLIAASEGFEQWPLLVMIERAKFRRLVEPDEELRLEAAIRSAHDRTFILDVQATCGGDRVATARLVFQCFRFDLQDADRDAFKAWAQQTFAALRAA